MVICPRCSIQHEVREEFCRKCGSFLLTEEEPFPKVEKIDVQLFCPFCRELRQQGTYCKLCGFPLVSETSAPNTVLEPLGKKSIKQRSQEWRRRSGEKKELEDCIKNLEEQKDKISDNTLDPLLARYRDRLESLTTLQQEIRVEFDSVKKRALKEIGILERELEPLPKRAEEFEFLYKESAITEADFLREKQQIKRGFESRKNLLKEYRQILSFLPLETKGRILPQKITRTLFRPLTLLIVCGLMILLGTGGYFLRQWYFQPNRDSSKERVTLLSIPSPSSSSKSSRTAGDEREVEEIKSLFETIRQANLQKNIDLFMTCFSRDFSGREKKRLETLETWDHFNYLNLTYDLKKNKISSETADVRLEWLVRALQKVNGKLQENKIILDATLRKENGHWKIRETRPVN